MAGAFIAVVLIGVLAGAAVLARFSDLLDQRLPERMTVIAAGTDTGSAGAIASSRPSAGRPRLGVALPRCGDLIVPEDRTRPNGTRIRIHYAVTRGAGARSAEPCAVVYLDGGPGGSPLSDGFLLEPFIARRDVVVFDQRGTGFSEPSLDCPEIDKLDPGAPSSQRSGAIRDCHVRLVAEGVDLAFYTTAEDAADVEDLRVTLRYPAWNLYGISYGTRLALAVMRDHPAGVRTAVLDSVYPPDVDAYGRPGRECPAVLPAAVPDGCVPEPACAPRFPGLR